MYNIPVSAEDTNTTNNYSPQINNSVKTSVTGIKILSE